MVNLLKYIDNFLKFLKTDRNTFVTYILTLISAYILVDRLVELMFMIFTGVGYSYWGPIEYTLAFAAVVFAFYFSFGSKFVKADVDKLRFFPYFADPAADLLASAVNNNRLKSYQFQKNHILDHSFFQLFVYHGTSAVFYYNDLSVESLYIWKGFDQYLRLVQIFLLNHFLFPLMSGSPHLFLHNHR